MDAIIGRPEVVVELAFVLVGFVHRRMLGHGKMRVVPDILFQRLVDVLVGPADVLDLEHALAAHRAERVGSRRFEEEQRVDVFAVEGKRPPLQTSYFNIRHDRKWPLSSYANCNPFSRHMARAPNRWVIEADRRYDPSE